MKKIFYSLILLLLLSGIFTSCRPYEEGPILSLKTRTTRLVGAWRVDTGPFLNGIPNDAEEVLFLFERDNDFSLTYKYDLEATSWNGSWDWASGTEELIIRIFDTNERYEFAILKLSNKEMRLIDLYDDSFHQFRKQ
ncbi:MAG: hypothetical protein AAGC85_05340 [Bacteroidota bacterium]